MTEDGRSLAGTLQTQNHGAVDYARDVSHVDGVRNLNTMRTFDDATSQTRTTTTSRDATTGVITTETRSPIDRARPPRARACARPIATGAAYARDTTFADGSTREVERTRTDTGAGAATIARTVTDRQGDVHAQTGTVVVTACPNLRSLCGDRFFSAAYPPHPPPN